ncbi:hypothetical protein HN51_001277 [Arachis hypogaea]
MLAERLPFPIDCLYADREHKPAAEYLNRKILEGKTIAEKLDSLIELTFLHLESCQSSGQLSEVFDVLVRSFQRTILFQFVVFYACALDPEDCGEKFAMVLVHFFLFPFFHSCAISCFWFLWSTQNVQILLGRLLMDVLKYQLVQFASVGCICFCCGFVCVASLIMFLEDGNNLVK